jgi:hypothetical protein
LSEQKSYFCEFSYYNIKIIPGLTIVPEVLINPRPAMLSRIEQGQKLIVECSFWRKVKIINIETTIS